VANVHDKVGPAPVKDHGIARMSGCRDTTDDPLHSSVLT
jgi:hypothetical protein